ncbi:MAG: SUMF1/EgtB/PvdO family nonheme iron enzyme [Planctomycetota bacterium]|nr:SUMF1/EgtB/PvdO family nonheme iron enzyme [Planctomycetota bacterium]
MPRSFLIFFGLALGLLGLCSCHMKADNKKQRLPGETIIRGEHVAQSQAKAGDRWQLVPMPKQESRGGTKVYRTVAYFPEDKKGAFRLKMKFSRGSLGAVRGEARGADSEGAVNGHRFVEVDAGTYTLGKAGSVDNPRRSFYQSEFELATKETSNAQFARFVRATKYITEAERRGYGQTYKKTEQGWLWLPTKGANWRKPNGPNLQGIEDREDHPVTQITLKDARAYCRWLGLRLPTLDEWEIATVEFPIKGGKADCEGNFWRPKSSKTQGAAEKYWFTAPVGAFKPNRNGIYDLCGNVFEFCGDRILRNQPTPTVFATLRGGSWACEDWPLEDIALIEASMSYSNAGFRVAR